ncbi:CBS domain-containing protein [Actinomadura scrupuli]|uniref:CBS domain-containing protein n=1 Tax=Actinomadura scrupuli TaxID=559629 RepID=UPI003D968D9C
MRRRTVRDVMTTAVVSAYEDADFKDIVTMMAKRGISALPVIGDEHRVIGVVSEADLLAKEEHKQDDDRRRLLESRHDRLSRAKAQGSTAGEIMSAPAITVRPGTTVVEAARMLDRHRVKRLPVVDEQMRLVGIVSRRDLLRVFIRPDKEIRKEIVEEVFKRLLWIDPEADGLTVTVDKGVVTLTGELEVDSLIPLAIRMTAATDGVVDVIGRLTSPEDAGSARPPLRT